MKNSLKDIYQNLDLYGAAVFIIALKNKFKQVCYANKSIPSPGSPVQHSCFIREDLKVMKAIFHRNNEVTVFFECADNEGKVLPAVAKFF